jgi:hypothetical protein
MGSVIEREFGYELIEKISGLPENELLSYLSVLKDSELLYERGIYPQSTYIFKHALTQVVIYESLLVRRQQELHRLTGRAIEELYADRLVEYYETLAYHFQYGADEKKALYYLESAANKAARSHYFPEVRRHYSEAVSMLDRMDAAPEHKRKRAELVVRWANAAVGSITPEVLEALKRSLVDVHGLNDLVLAVRLSRRLGTAQISFGDLNGFATFEECLNTAEKLGDETRIALVIDSTGRAMMLAGRYHESIAWLGRSIPRLERMDHMIEVSASLGYLAMSHAECGEFEEAERWGLKGLELAEKLNNPGSLLFIRMCLGRVKMKRGSWEQGEKELVGMIEQARRYEYPVQLAEGTALLGLATYRQGLTKKGLAQIVEGVGILEPVGSHSLMPHLPLWYGRLAQLNAEHGRWTEAEAYLDKCMELDFEWNMGRVYCELAQALIAAHQAPADWEAAEAHAETALMLAKQLDLRPDLAVGHLEYAKLLSEKGDVERAREQQQFATTLFRDMEMLWWLEQTEEMGKRFALI